MGGSGSGGLGELGLGRVKGWGECECCHSEKLLCSGMCRELVKCEFPLVERKDSS